MTAIFSEREVITEFREYLERQLDQVVSVISLNAISIVSHVVGVGFVSSMSHRIFQHIMPRFWGRDWITFFVDEIIGALGMTSFLSNMQRNRSISYSDGSKYEGECVKEVPHGRGVYTLKSGVQWIGEWKRGIMHGEYTARLNNGSTPFSEIIRYDNGKIVRKDRMAISEPMFLYPLFGVSVGSPPGYSYGILSDYLRVYFEGNEEVMDSVVRPLLNAMSVYETSLSATVQKKQEILQALEKGISYLLPFGFDGHSMLLNLIPTADGRYVDCEIYNSGEGLSFHQSRLGKHQLMKQVRVPIHSITLKKLGEWIQYERFSTAQEAYQSILFIENARVIDEPSRLYKTAQKGLNCQLESLFAFIAEKIDSSLYRQFRNDLFRDSLNGALENQTAFQCDLLQLEEIRKKMAKVKRAGSE